MNSQTVSEIQKHSYIDSLRGIAILMVIVYHAAIISPPQNHILVAILSFGERGVQLFYLVSAITLCMSWDQRAHQETAPIKAFFARRFFRIAPLYYTVIAMHTALLLLSGEDPLGIAPHVFANLTFTHALHPASINHLVPGGWSVGIEMLFYLMLPWLIIKSKNKSAIFCMASISASLLILIASKYAVLQIFHGVDAITKKEIQNFAFFSFTSQLPVFLIGMLYYKHKNHRLAKTLIFTLTALGILFYLIAYTSTNDYYNKTFHTFKHIIACPALLLLISTYENSNHPITRTKVLMFIGVISFGLYLLHFFSFPIIGRLKLAADIGFLTTLTIMLVATIPIAYLAYKFIEMPGVGLGKQFIKNRICQ